MDRPGGTVLVVQNVVDAGPAIHRQSVMSLKHFRHWTKKVADFTRGRASQADGAFIADCDLPRNADAERIALVVRRLFAEEGSVDPQFIYASDRYPEDLGILPSWDSIDMLDIVFRLEKQLNLKIGRGALPMRFTVREFVHRLLEVCGESAAAT